MKMKIENNLAVLPSHNSMKRKGKKMGGKLELMEKFLGTRNLEREAML